MPRLASFARFLRPRRGSVRRAALAGAVGALGAAALACSGGDLTLPGEGVPTAITVVGGDAQTGTTGAALGDSLAVRVRDAGGRGLAGVLLRWEPTGGRVSPASGRTDSTGYAATRRILGDTAGSYPTLVVVDGSPEVRASFTAVATPDPARRLALALITAPPASAHTGERFSRQPELQLRDGDGRDVARSGVAVTAAVESGQGLLQGTTTRPTDASGRARFTDLAITGATGDHVLIFAADGIASVRSARIAVSTPEIPRTPTRIAVHAGDGQEAEVGATVPIAPAVLVSDGADRPVEGAEVTFAVTAGRGSVSGSKQKTGADGIATVGGWTLGSAPGTNRLVATTSGVAAGATFTATAKEKSPPPPPPPPPPPSPPEPTATALAFATQPSDTKRRETIRPLVQVQLLDRDGKLVPRDGVTIRVALARGAEDGKLQGDTEVSTRDGIATFSLAIDGRGTFSLRASADGLSSATSRDFNVRR
ncbi:MAG TPA: hypothetical protein VFS40_09670 [Gemmatimonadales bacterium]|nr:hypothetical protein [Gemmatimonadales bacterium]